MTLRVLLGAILMVVLAACAQAQPARAPIQAEFVGLNMADGGYARFERRDWYCDYKCFNFPGRWFADREIDVFAEPSINAPVIDRLQPNEWVRATKYEEHIQPRRAIVTRAGAGMRVGDVVHELWSRSDDEGNGATTFWYRGRMIEVSTGAPNQPEVRYEQEPGEVINWIYVEREGGRKNGWLREPRMPGVEYAVDECPAFDVSAPCRDLRGKAAAPAQIFAKPEPFVDCVNCPSMVWIPDQKFAVSQYEVTVANWNACVADGGCPGEGIQRDGKLPAANMSRGADVYLQWLSAKTGKNYRWLTLQEWQIAAFPGGRTQKFYWGNEAPVCDRGARNGAAFGACNLQGPLRVGSFAPNAYGLYDVLGNVSELVIANESEMAQMGGTWRTSAEELGGMEGEFAGQDGSDLELRGLRVARDR